MTKKEEELREGVFGDLREATGGGYPISGPTRIKNLPVPLNVVAEIVSRNRGVKIREEDLDRLDLTVDGLIRMVESQLDRGERL
jgi:hypothetical protein